MAFIHVIIPVYNAERYLRETVASVLAQPTEEIDIVLVNDGSTDGSASICDELAAKESRIHVIHQKNAGVSAARNAGIEAVLGTGATEGYITFLDSDDLWCPNAFTSEQIASVRGSDPDVIGFSMYGCDALAERYCVLSQYQAGTKEFPQKHQTDFLWINGSFATHLYHIRLFRENPVRFVVGCHHNEDVIFSAKMLFCSRRLRFSDRFLYIYRRNRVSATGRNKYRPDNATHVPDAWYDAADFVDQCEGIPEENRRCWKHFCISTSAIRCLELIRELSSAGYTYSEIRDCFSQKPYLSAIEKLRASELAPWQQPDLEQYRQSPESFCRVIRRKGRLRNPVRKLLLCCGLLEILDRRRYTITEAELLRSNERCSG